ncbi:Serine carboxypeptidase-like [Parasponia andersonii]|uniref:Serine carboxypeptidase-like n=1 Tax=Parasponia andersonii TaxID=3476 RepID=A0A2P5AUU6_PARAD|nr:Serine carboxypeptidase-like [Parasponia andersonii]
MAAPETERQIVWLWAKMLMLVHIHLIIFLVLFTNHVVPSSIVKSLPGFSGSLPFRLETGYIVVDEKEDVQFFYYYVESEGNPRDDPLMFWFTGGPGCSALCGLAFEIGPIKFNMVEYDGSLPTLVLNPYSWTKAASIIFVDAPVGTGFSFSRSLEGVQTGDSVYAKRTLNFLRMWLLAHPEFSSHPLYLGGDSFSGIIIPIIAEKIAESAEANQILGINLQGYVLGNPATDIELDGNSKVEFAHRMALIPDELYRSVKKTCKGQYTATHKNDSLCAKDLEAISVCTENLSEGYILDPNCYRYMSDYDQKMDDNRRSLLENPVKRNPFQRSLNLGFPPLENPNFGCRNYVNKLVYHWANDKTVQVALHIQKGTVKTWIRCDRNLPYRHQVDNVVSYHKSLNSRGYRALIYSGDHDMMIPYIGTQTWIKSLNLPISGQWRPWIVDDEVAGYVTEYSKGSFTFATVKGGGHTAPEYYPKECLAMFKRWISQEPL